jgi:hypothetical protein
MTTTRNDNTEAFERMITRVNAALAEYDKATAKHLAMLEAELRQIASRGLRGEALYAAQRGANCAYDTSVAPAAAVFERIRVRAVAEYNAAIGN